MNEDLFGSIKQTITETAGAVGKKTEEFVETPVSYTHLTLPTNSLV